MTGEGKPALAQVGIRFDSGIPWIEHHRRQNWMQVYVELVDDLIHVYPPMRMFSEVAAIPGSVTHAKEMYFTLPLTWNACLQLRSTFGQLLKVGPKLARWSKQVRDERIEPLMALKRANDADGDPAVFSWVRPSIQFHKIAKRFIDGDDMRLGKTVSGIKALKEYAEEHGLDAVCPIIIFGPASAKQVWVEHFAEWWPELDKVVAPKSGLGRAEKALKEEPNVFITLYEYLQYLSNLKPWGGTVLKACKDCNPANKNITPQKCEIHSKLLNQRVWKTIIMDEGHRASNPEAIMTRAIWSLRDQGADFVIYKTGTIPDDPDRVWCMLHTVDPEAWPSRKKFRAMYCNVVEDPWTGYDKVEGWTDNQDALDDFNTLFAPYFIRRTKQVVYGTEFKEPIVEVREAEMTPKQAKAYHDLRTKMFAEVEGGIFWTDDPRVKFARLRQFASAHAELTPEGGLLLSEPSGKLDVMEELLHEIGADSVVIFAEQTQLIELAMKRLGDKAVKLVGGMSDYARELSITLFQDGEVPYICANTAAGGEAIKLDRADTIIYLQRPWYRIANEQSKDRVFKPGRQAFIFDIITPDTVEDRVFQSLDAHDAAFEKLVKDKELVKQWLTR